MSRIVASASASRPARPRSGGMTPPTLAIVPRAAASAKQLTGADFRLLIALSVAGGRYRPVPLSQAELAAALGLDRRTIRGCIARLLAAGYLRVDRNVRADDGQYFRMAYELTF